MKKADKTHTVLKRVFPGALTEENYLAATVARLARWGFSADNTIAAVSVCRDEICQPLVALVREHWGEAFNLSSLAGMFLAGRTALRAAMHHAPCCGGRERFVFYLFSHIALDADGRFGRVRRKGQPKPSTACGALCAFLGELEQKKLVLSRDENDLEMGLVRSRLLSELPFGRVPDLLELTQLARRLSFEDLRRALELELNSKHCDWAVLSGVQIHLPAGNLVWPAESLAWVGGKFQRLSLGSR